MIKNLIIAFSIILLHSNLSNKDKVKWDGSVKLELTDYRAEPNWEITNVVHTATRISLGYALKKNSKGEIIDFTAQVNSYFYPNKSWYKKSSDVPLKDLIIHERLHFDIAELYSRIFRKRISELKPNKNIVNQLTKLNDSIGKIFRKRHQLYDFETNGGLTKKIQKQWEDDIERELIELSEYAVN